MGFIKKSYFHKRPGQAQATNDLDLTTIESVEALLSEYKGVLVVVSHDRQFVECTAERLFVLRGDGLVRLFDDSYSEVRTAADSTAVGMHLPAHAPPCCLQVFVLHP